MEKGLDALGHGAVKGSIGKKKRTPYSWDDCYECIGELFWPTALSVLSSWLAWPAL